MGVSNETVVTTEQVKQAEVESDFYDDPVSTSGSVVDEAPATPAGDKSLD